MPWEHDGGTRSVGGYSPKCLEGVSVLKNTPMLAYGSQYSPKNTDLGPLEPLWAPINVPGSSFSTAWGFLGSPHPASCMNLPLGTLSSQLSHPSCQNGRPQHIAL